MSVLSRAWRNSDSASLNSQGGLLKLLDSERLCTCTVISSTEGLKEGVWVVEYLIPTFSEPISSVTALTISNASRHLFSTLPPYSSVRLLG